MPTANDMDLLGECLCLVSPAGTGKTVLALQAPQPHAVFCIDKAVIGRLPNGFPGYDRKQTFYTKYLPPDVDLTKDNIDRDRSIFDKIKNDLIDIRNALHSKKPEFTLRSEKETWPLPKTIILEGADLLKDKLIDHYLRRHGKSTMTDFEAQALNHWGNVGKEMATILEDFTRLPALCPVNVVVTLGWDKEMKKLDWTGNYVPDFGGKLDERGPRMFKDLWMPITTGEKFFVVTKAADKYAIYKGLRSGSFGLKAIEDVTLDLAKPTNHWQRLFGGV